MQVAKFSKKQLQVLAFPNSSYDALICDGSVRGGKTSVMSVAFVLWAMRGFNKQNFGICSKTDKTCLRNVIRPLMAMAYMQTHFSMQLHIASGDLVISDGKHTNTFYIYGGKDEASYQKIQGVTLAGVFLDEVTLMPRSFVEQALARCSVSGRKYWFNCNPAGQMHWFYQNWILKAKEHNALRLHFLMDDNPLRHSECNNFSFVAQNRRHRRLVMPQRVLLQWTRRTQTEDCCGACRRTRADACRKERRPKASYHRPFRSCIESRNKKAWLTCKGCRQRCDKRYR